MLEDLLVGMIVLTNLDIPVLTSRRDVCMGCYDLYDVKGCLLQIEDLLVRDLTDLS